MHILQALVMNDEKYFSLSGSNMPGNSFYYTKDNCNSVQVKKLKKIEDKVMVWLGVSEKGISKPFIVSSKLGIRSHNYINECLKND